MNYGVSVATLALVASLVIWKNGGLNSHGPLDTAMFIAFLAFLAWLLTPARNKSGGHENPDKGIAFRLGKALNRIRRTF